MKPATVYEAKTHLSALPAAVEEGAEVLATRQGRPGARLGGPAGTAPREAGDWQALPGWAGFRYHPAVFAPLGAEQAAAEGWEARARAGWPMPAR